MGAYVDAHVSWVGSISDGYGVVGIGDSLGPNRFDAASRHACRDGYAEGAEPERLLAAAQAGDYAMMLAGRLSEEGYTASSINVNARVHLASNTGSRRISRIEITASARVANISESLFETVARTSLDHSAVSTLFGGADIILGARRL